MAERTRTQQDAWNGKERGGRQNLSLDGTWQFGTFLLSASRSSAVHGKSNTVQPAALRLLAIVKF